MPDEEPILVEVESLRPYLDLAREIKREIDSLAADPDITAEMLADAIDSIPARERSLALRKVFDELPAERQWDVLERVFGDGELRQHLAGYRERLLAQTNEERARAELAHTARARRQLDTRLLQRGEQLALGFFRDADLHAAVKRGHISDTCARRLILRATEEPGALRVIDDAFNPRGGLFVTAEYDDRVWRNDRLHSHATVRVGSIVESASGAVLEPILYPGARTDFEIAGELVEGRLPVGYVMLGNLDLFAGE